MKKKYKDSEIFATYFGYLYPSYMYLKPKKIKKSKNSK